MDAVVIMPPVPLIRLSAVMVIIVLLPLLARAKDELLFSLPSMNQWRVQKPNKLFEWHFRNNIAQSLPDIIIICCCVEECESGWPGCPCPFFLFFLLSYPLEIVVR